MLDTEGLTFDRVERDVVFAMYSGLALLLDVYHPVTPNGLGIVHASGSGYTTALSADATPLKEAPHVGIEAFPLVEAGYTVFTINHRAAPRFRWPDPFHDARRAVRFVRHHAERFGIDAHRLGAIGGSSAGHLVAMLGLCPDAGDPEATSPVERESAALQCVVARAGLYDLTRVDHVLPVFGFFALGDEERRILRDASPLHHVAAGAPPFLLTVGAEDGERPGDAQTLAAALTAAGVPVEVLLVPGAGHGPGYPGSTMDLAAIQQRYVTWFQEHL